MWTVDHQIFHGNPAEDEVWSNVAAYLFERRFQHDGGQQMSIYATAIDSGGHHSNAVYDFARRNKARRVFAVRGRPFGEKAIKDGAGQVDIDWRGKRIKKGVILWHVGTNLAKDLLHSRLAIETPGPGYVHLSEDLSDEWFRQFSGEARVSRKTATGVRTLWTALRKRVEALDCAVYALWVAEHLGLSRKSDAWWDAMAEKLDALPPPRDEEAEAPPPSTTRPAAPAKAVPVAPAARAGPAVKPARRRVAASSYLRGRR